MQTGQYISNPGDRKTTGKITFFARWAMMETVVTNRLGLGLRPVRVPTRVVRHYPALKHMQMYDQ